MRCQAAGPRQQVQIRRRIRIHGGGGSKAPPSNAGSTVGRLSDGALAAALYLSVVGIRSGDADDNPSDSSRGGGGRKSRHSSSDAAALERGPRGRRSGRPSAAAAPKSSGFTAEDEDGAGRESGEMSGGGGYDSNFETVEGGGSTAPSSNTGATVSGPTDKALAAALSLSVVGSGSGSGVSDDNLGGSSGQGVVQCESNHAAS